MFTVLYNLQDASPASWISAIYVIVLFTRLFLLYSSLHKKIGIQIFVYNSFVSVMQKWQLHFLFFSISIKNLKWKQHFYTDTSFISWNYLLLNMDVCWDCYHGGEEEGAGKGDPDEQPLSDKPTLIRCGETYRTWQ